MNKRVRGVLVGIDTGGTFTDLVAVDAGRGRYRYHKVPTLTADPAQGILDGIAELLDQNGLKRGDVTFLVLGTTLATNSVLEGKWARTASSRQRAFATSWSSRASAARTISISTSPSPCRPRRGIAASRSRSASEPMAL